MTRTERMPIFIATVLLLAAMASAAEQPANAGWPVFHADAARQGRSPVDFATPPFSRLWTFDLGRYTWRYCRGASVWSANAVAGEVEGRMRVFVGAYEHNVYCLDALTGTEIWRFTTGCLVNASPAFAVVAGAPMVYVASADRTFYALDARSGAKRWGFETQPWTYTVGESIAGSPLVAEVDGRATLFATMWNSDARPLRSVQSGEAFAFDAASGKLLWRRQVATMPLTSPTFAEVEGQPRLFVAGEHGAVHGLDARSGEQCWRYISDHKIFATPVAAEIDGEAAVIIANNFGMVRCLSARTGQEIWKYKTGHEVLSTAALIPAAGKQTLFLGSADRAVHAVHAKSGRALWPRPFVTGKYIVASPAVAAVQGHPVVFVNSLDNNLYMLSATDGCEIMRFASGPMLWDYETRGISIWSSPTVLRADGRGIVIFPAHDGKLYAFTDRPRGAPGEGDATLVAWQERGGDAPAPRAARGPLFYAVPALAALAFLAGAALVLRGPPRSA